MAEIIKFRQREHRDKPNRFEALVKGQIEVYRCDMCGENFEVLFGKKPERCPHCMRYFTGWNEEKE